jgi:hypothetical protein
LSWRRAYAVGKRRSAGREDVTQSASAFACPRASHDAAG